MGDYESKDIVDLLKRMISFIIDFKGDIPGASTKDCGNYQDMNLQMAKYECKKYIHVLNNITEDRLVYPE